MAVTPIPVGHHSVTPYLIVAGVPKLIDFLARAFGATEMHRTSMPDGSVMHAQVRVGDSPVMMGEARGGCRPMPAMLYLYVPDVDATYRSAMESGATSDSEPRDEFWGDRVSAVKDPSGNTWWIATHVKDVAPDDLEEHAAEAMKQRKASGGAGGA